MDLTPLNSALTVFGIEPGTAALIMLGIRLLGEAFSSLRNGGGLVGLWRTLLYGQNLPKAIADDYKEELNPTKK